MLVLEMMRQMNTMTMKLIMKSKSNHINRLDKIYFCKQQYLTCERTYDFAIAESCQVLAENFSGPVT